MNAAQVAFFGGDDVGDQAGLAVPFVLGQRGNVAEIGQCLLQRPEFVFEAEVSAAPRAVVLHGLAVDATFGH